MGFRVWGCFGFLGLGRLQVFRFSSGSRVEDGWGFQEETS